jgi:hypothetical protein
MKRRSRWFRLIVGINWSFTEKRILSVVEGDNRSHSSGTQDRTLVEFGVSDTYSWSGGRIGLGGQPGSRTTEEDPNG